MAMELAGLKECLHDVLNKLKLRVATFISDRLYASEEVHVCEVWGNPSNTQL